MRRCIFGFIGLVGWMGGRGPQGKCSKTGGPAPGPPSLVGRARGGPRAQYFAVMLVVRLVCRLFKRVHQFFDGFDLKGVRNELFVF